MTPKNEPKLRKICPIDCVKSLVVLLKVVEK